MIDKSNQLAIFKSLDVEISTLCNINCSFCPREAITRSKEIMTKPVFETLHKWIPKNLGITFSGMGEPLTNPNIVSYIKQLANKNIKVFLKTNGILLSPTVFKNLKEAGVWHIQISIISSFENHKIHSISKANFLKLEKNLEYLSSNSTQVSLSLVEGNNLIENEERKKFAQAYKLPLNISKLHSRGGELYSVCGKTKENTESEFCQIFPYISFITSNGDILSCCHDLHGTSKLGNIDHISFSELQKIKKERIARSKWFPFCANCDDDLRHKFRDTLSLQES